MVFEPSRGGVAARASARRGAIEIDAGALAGRVVLRNQGRHRRIDEGGIAEIARAIGVGAFHRLDDQMQRGRGALLHVGHRKAFEDIQRLQQHDAARRRQRHRHDVIAAIVAAHRRADHRLVGFEIVCCHDAAGVGDRLHQLLGDGSFVEAARTLFDDCRQRCREIALDQRCRLRATACRRGERRSSSMTASARSACGKTGRVSAMSSVIVDAVGRQREAPASADPPA